MQPASLHLRLAGGFVDGICVWLAVMFAALFIGQVSVGDGGIGVNIDGWPFIVALALPFALFAVTEGLTGKTPGKWLTKTQVRSVHGRPPSWAEVSIRNGLRYVDILCCYALGLVVILATSRRQRIGDLAAGTMVIADDSIPLFPTDESEGGWGSGEPADLAESPWSSPGA